MPLKRDDNIEDKNLGIITLVISFAPGEVLEAKKPTDEEKITGKLILTIESAKNVLKMDSDGIFKEGKADPFCKAYLRSNKEEVFKTKTIKNSLAPN